MRLAFGFRAGSGKDYASEYLRGKYGGYNLKFAAPVKDTATLIQTHLGLPVEKDRELLQWLGTDYGRKRDPNVWIRQMQEAIRVGPPAHLFVSDMRFPNEADALKELGFYLVRLDRELPTGASWATHESETALEKYEGFDFVIKNCGSPKHYEGQIEILWQKAKEADDLINRQCLVIE